MVKGTKATVVQTDAKAGVVPQEQLSEESAIRREQSWENDLRRNGISFPSNWTVPGLVPGIREISGEHQR